eukprot:169221-Amphidinium_carterae.1
METGVIVCECCQRLGICYTMQQELLSGSQTILPKVALRDWLGLQTRAHVMECQLIVSKQHRKMYYYHAAR